ncbi:hypothetical protein [Micromonospora haikouensis]|uniref:hypothetical protein n=1 Tax=Micromonospora haikouensis TaxID=686309 RepID=UPI003D717441
MSPEPSYYEQRLRGLADELHRLLGYAQDTWRQYLRLCERTGMRTNPLVVPAAQRRLAALVEEVDAFRRTAHESTDWSAYLDRCEVFRVLVRDLANLATLHDWQSPAYESSNRPHLFHVDDHGYRGLLGYRRVHHPILTRLEQQYRCELGYGQLGPACFLTSSGMGAFTAVENWLVRDRLRAGDRIGYMARTYFESRDQLSKLKGVTVQGVEVERAADVVEYVRSARPAAFFVEPINNEDETTLIDVVEMLRSLGRLPLEQDLFVVLDTSMSAGGEGALFAIPELRDNPRLHLVQIESLLKYRQHGLDRINGGAILVDSQFAREVFVQRERCGAFLPDLQSFEMLGYTAHAHDERMLRIKQNSETFCRELLAAMSEPLRKLIVLGTPIATTHADHTVYQHAYRYLGGVVPLAFTRELGLDVLQEVISTTVTDCRRSGVTLHHSTSFGFTSTHIGIAATGGARLTRPFLRVSVGEDPVACIEHIAGALAAALAEHLLTPTYAGASGQATVPATS